MTTPAIQALTITLDGVVIANDYVSGLSIDLSDRGGYESATLTLVLPSVNSYPTPFHADLLVSYQGVELFRGRCEEKSLEVGDDLAKTIVFTGPIVKLDDHQAFRRVYVDSDLENWETDQGPRTSPDSFESITAATI